MATPERCSALFYVMSPCHFKRSDVTVHRNTVFISWFELRSNRVVHRKRGRGCRPPSTAIYHHRIIGLGVSPSLSSFSSRVLILLSEAQTMAILFSRERSRSDYRGSCRGVQQDSSFTFSLSSRPFTLAGPPREGSYSLGPADD